MGNKKQKKNNWMKVLNKTGVTEIYINADIYSDEWNDGWDKANGYIDNNTYPLEFKAELDKAEDEVHIHFNSGGGSLFAGVAIANMIKQSEKHVVAMVDGVAGSAASIVALACDVVKVPADAYLMIHRVLFSVYGNADDFREAIKTAEALEEGILNGYMEKAQEGVTRETIMELMHNETWLTGSKAAEIFKVEVDPSMHVQNYANTNDKKVKYPAEVLNKIKAAQEAENSRKAAEAKAKAEEAENKARAAQEAENKAKDLEIDLALAGIY